MRRSIHRGTLLMALALTLAACGAAGATGTGGQPTSAAGATPPPGGTTPGATGAGPVTGHLGDELTFADPGGDQIEATLVKVFDPATPDGTSVAPLPSGARWVGVQLTIVDHSPDAGGAVSNVDVMASDGSNLTSDQVYQGYARPIGYFQGCTDATEIGQSGVQPDQPYTRCQGFVVPDGVTLTQVGLTVGDTERSGALVADDEAIWSIP